MKVGDIVIVTDREKAEDYGGAGPYIVQKIDPADERGNTNIVVQNMDGSPVFYKGRWSTGGCWSTSLAVDVFLNAVAGTKE